MADSSTQLAGVAFNAWAVVGGTKVDLAGFQVSYAVNSIPQAQLWLPSGFNLRDGSISPVHTVLSNLTDATVVEIYIEILAVTATPGIRAFVSPKGPRIVFRGKAIGRTPGASFNERHYTLKAVGWLADLATASCLSQSSGPGNPGRYSYGAITGEGAGGQLKAWAAETRAAKFITEFTLSKDIWNDAFLPWFNELAAKDGIDLFDRSRSKPKAPVVTDATKALALMNADSDSYIPSRFRQDLDVNTVSHIYADVQKLTESPDSLAQQTLWDVIIGRLTAHYMLAVIPLIDRALVVPFIPGCYGNGPTATINNSEYGSCTGDIELVRPVAGFGILSGLASFAGGVTDNEPIIGGFYDAKIPGIVLVNSGPPWLSSALSPGVTAPDSTGGNQATVSDAFNPTAKATNGILNEAPKIDSLLNAYAHARYVQERLKGRSAVVSGPLRFDIAPGTRVTIRDPDGDGSPGPTDYLGEVIRVTITVNAENPNASSSFHVGAVRSMAESQAQTSSLAEHPLYTKTFDGAPLAPWGRVASI